MADVRRVPVPTDAPGLASTTNAYVVGATDALLVDPASRSDALDDAVAERSVSHVAVTHHHPDHVGALAAYADRADATVWSIAGREDAFADAAGVAPDRTFRPGDAIPTGAGPVTALDTPGHAPEHVAFLVDGDALVGDLAVAEGSVAVAAPEGDLRAYRTSLRRLHARDPARLFPGHGPPVEDPRATCSRLLAHRRRRDERVAAAVADGAETIDEVLEAAYDRDLAGVRDLARATVRAHLESLAVEGRLTWDGERARP